MVSIRYSSRTYAAAKCDDGRIIVAVEFPRGPKTKVAKTETVAYRWLGDHGLRRGRIRGLLDAELRGIGIFADPAHPKRVK